MISLLLGVTAMVVVFGGLYKSWKGKTIGLLMMSVGNGVLAINSLMRGDLGWLMVNILFCVLMAWLYKSERGYGE